MTYNELVKNIREKHSYLCVGLDSDIKLIPPFLKKHKNSQFEFNKIIVDATAPYTIAFKPNIAFYESEGVEGWLNLKLTVDYIKNKYPDIFLIADAKRGDIGNTSKLYARTFFESLDFDAVTVSPYMGSDSVLPFLEYKNKWAILLALTSNRGAEDFQMLGTESNQKLFQQVFKKSSNWGNCNNMMYVVGATKASLLTLAREIVPNHFLLVPGIGVQGGNIEEVIKYGKNENNCLIINASRSIIFADTSEKFAKVAEQKAKELAMQMKNLMNSF